MKPTSLALAALAALATLALNACGGGEEFVEAQSAAVGEKRALAVNVSGRTLLFSYAVATNAKVVVGPAVGRVEVYGLPDIADGTVSQNIGAIEWRSGAAVDAVVFNPVGVTGGSKIGFEMVSAAQQVTLGDTLVTGAGMDALLYGFTALHNARVAANLVARTGAGMDKLNFALKGLPATAFSLVGNIDMGNEDDEALLLTEGLVTGTIPVNCEAGVDKAIGFAQTVGCELN